MTTEYEHNRDSLQDLYDSLRQELSDLEHNIMTLITGSVVDPRKATALKAQKQQIKNQLQLLEEDMHPDLIA